ncbi:Two-component response regulator [Burkholderiales bacterium]|nr:Two-component response regulator [Burkholderiales bacterium]HXQ22155.1 response regulator [Candidatus Acidoferrales bacterium]
MANPTLSLLLVEDDDVAAEAACRGLARSGVNFPVVWVEDGLVALAVLRGQSTRAQVARPRIVLLDLNMPRMNGFEFLAAIRADRAFRDEVIFVLTTSDDDEDRSRAYREQIAGYIVKSAVGPQFAKLAGLLLAYRDAVCLP